MDRKVLESRLRGRCELAVQAAIQAVEAGWGSEWRCGDIFHDDGGLLWERRAADRRLAV